jgi:hypothetical protein
LMPMLYGLSFMGAWTTGVMGRVSVAGGGDGTESVAGGGDGTD